MECNAYVFSKDIYLKKNTLKFPTSMDFYQEPHF